MRTIFRKYREVIAYLFFGGLTTLVNIVVFAILEKVMNYQVANILAWVGSVLFAYMTNKLWVFTSRTKNKKELLKEISSFFLFRGLSLLMDILIMWIGISLLHGNPLLTKIIDNVVVVIANYVFSKFYIFKKKA